MRHADLPLSLKASEYQYARYAVHPGPGVSKDAILSSGYWAHVASSLRVGDIVEVRPQNSAYYMELWLVQKRPGLLTWKTIRDVEFSAPVEVKEVPADRFIVEWVDGVTKHRIIDTHTPGRDEIASGYATMEEALEEIAILREEE